MIPTTPVRMPYSGPDAQILGVLVVPYKIFDQKISRQYLLTVRRGAENITRKNAAASRHFDNVVSLPLYSGKWGLASQICNARVKSLKASTKGFSKEMT